jgi:hypothetical protein
MARFEKREDELIVTLKTAAKVENELLVAKKRSARFNIPLAPTWITLIVRIEELNNELDEKRVRLDNIECSKQRYENTSGL